MFIAFASLITSPSARAAEKIVGNSCTSDANATDWDTITQCVSGTFVRAPMFFGSASSYTCNSTNAGLIQWTGSALEYCDGANWNALGGQENTPDDFSFTNVTGQPLSSTVTSNAVTLVDYSGVMTAYCYYNCTGVAHNGTWSTASYVTGFACCTDTIAIETQTPGSYGTLTTVAAVVGNTQSSNWNVTTVNTANAFSFTDVTNQPASTTITSNAVTLSWTGGGTLAATCGSGCTGISRNGGSFVAGPVSGFGSSDTIAIEQASSGSYATQTSATVTVGGTSTTWHVTTANSANAFSFTDVTGQPLSTTISSNTVTLSWTGGNSLTATCGSGCTEISINGASFVSGPVTGVVSGNTIAIEQASSGSYGTQTGATITVGGTSTTWHVTTVKTANAFSFTNVTGEPLSTTITSGDVALSWTGGGTLTATCGAGCTDIFHNDVDCVSTTCSGFASGDNIAIAQTTSGGYNGATTAKVTVGSTVSSTWSATTVKTANAFSFTNVTGKPLNTTISSNAVSLSWTGGGTLTATCGSGCTDIIHNGSDCGSTTCSGFASGDTIAIEQLTSNSLNTATLAAVTVGSTASSSWSATTVASNCTLTVTSSTSFSPTASENGVGYTLIGGGGGSGSSGATATTGSTQAGTINVLSTDTLVAYAGGGGGGGGTGSSGGPGGGGGGYFGGGGAGSSGSNYGGGGGGSSALLQNGTLVNYAAGGAGSGTDAGGGGTNSGGSAGGSGTIGSSLAGGKGSGSNEGSGGNAGAGGNGSSSDAGGGGGGGYGGGGGGAGGTSSKGGAGGSNGANGSAGGNTGGTGGDSGTGGTSSNGGNGGKVTIQYYSSGSCTW